MRNVALLIAAALCATAALTAQSVTARGAVTDADGKPLDHALVLVYTAAVRTGYDRYCPSCYVDCGKRAITAADGSYSIAGLSPDLTFNLLIARDGYQVAQVRGVDPTKGPAETAKLKPRAPLSDVAQAVRGRVLDRDGEPVRDALVEQEGAIFKDGTMMYGGGREWIAEIAVTNEAGEFELAHTRPLRQAIISVSARGKAGRLATLPAGTERTSVTVLQGATVRGRLLADGKPVANAQVGLSTVSRSAGESYAEMRVATDENGVFTLTNVPAGRVWQLHGKMDSLASRGLALGAKYVATKDDGQTVQMGDLAVQRAFTVRGRVVLAEGKPIPAGSRLHLWPALYDDDQSMELPADGRFEFRGAGAGPYTLGPAVQGYKPDNAFALELLVESDAGDVTVALSPAKR